ncbi:hypothetical protein JCM33374_g5056 [Metschnikowia sp. JCM 33374]|nr:hypothetical protein JCM33374_g5056 [Metschnikowia sp. JCM 33374]
MVSVFDITKQNPLWGHISTGVLSLDHLLALQREAVLDMQSVPANFAFTAVICSLIVSHLSASSASVVVIVETLNPFSWSCLQAHPSFDVTWIDSERILLYSVHSFAQLYAFFTFMPLARRDPGRILMVVTNFHELMELYRLQADVTHKQILLKHQIDKNNVFLENFAQVSEEGFQSVECPPEPVCSRDNPSKKVQHQIDEILSMISGFTLKNSAVVVLMGHLDVQSRSSGRVEECAHPSLAKHNIFQTAPVPFHTEDTRLVLVPAMLNPFTSDTPSLADSKVTARVVFYNDWFFKSPLFQRENRVRIRHPRFVISVAKVIDFNSNINEPVYFHYKRLPISGHDSNSSLPDPWLIDLS